MPSKAQRNFNDLSTYPDWWHESMKTRDERLGWWQDARFGQFMHWGAYSVLGGGYQGEILKDQYGEHVARLFEIPKEDYIKHAASQFRPEKFDADEWVLRAKNAGMKFFVITAKHHDGFAIYHSKYSEFDVEDTAKWPRDPLKELSEACKRHGLKFGVYYSHAQDWYAPGNVQNNWDFPKNIATHEFARKHKVGRWYQAVDEAEVEAYLPKAWDYYINKSIPQVIELIQDYGVELFWFDTSNWMPTEFNARVLQTVRELAPNMVVNARVQRGYGDYEGGPDGPVAYPYFDGPWECIQSTLHSWGYNKYDEENRRSAEYLLEMLSTVTSKNGVVMVNIGPKPDGTWVEGDLETYEEFASWWSANGESIRGAGPAPIGVHNWGVVTAKDKSIFLHLHEWPVDNILEVGGLDSKVSKAILLDSNKKLKTQSESGVLHIDLPADPKKPYHSVVELVFKSEPKGEFRRPVKAEMQNRFHVFDTPFLSEGVQFGGEKPEAAVILRWDNADDSMRWPIVVTEDGEFDVHIVYDIPRKANHTGEYVVAVGDQTLTGIVSRNAAGDSGIIEHEMKLMNTTAEKMPRVRVLTDNLGTLKLKPGDHDLVLKSPNKTGRGVLFNPRAIYLVPAK
ncbi:MAG: alpha-L-fucosidase [Opitutales bacterium]